MRVCIVDGGFAYYELVKKLGHSPVMDISIAEMVMFTGGADVSPHIYGDKKHKETYASEWRDGKEIEIFKRTVALGIPMVGICRGGQFLNVMSGGRMYQHVDKHATGAGHEITDLLSGETVLVSSTHHQMMMPSPRGLLVASSTLLGTREWYEGEIFKKDVSEEDIEVVYYEHTRSLCFQPHPEFTGAAYDGMFNYFRSCLERFVYAEAEV